MAKKKKNNKRKVETKKVEVEENEKLNLQDKLFVVFCIVLFFVAFYVLTLYITHKHNDSSTSNTITESEISYQEIILGRSLSMSEGEYYVIYYDGSDSEIASTCSEIVTNYRSSHDTKLYYVDMSSAFNSKYVSEESNPNATSVDELSINGPTVIKVVDKAIAEYVEGINNIQNILS